MPAYSDTALATHVMHMPEENVLAFTLVRPMEITGSIITVFLELARI
jgi:hypothetical protein